MSVPPVPASSHAVHVLRTWGLLAAAAATLNLVIWGVARLAGAALIVDQAGTATSIVWPAVALASALPLLLAAAVFAVTAPRIGWVRQVWAPVVVLLGLASLYGLTAARDGATGVAVGAMHLVVTAVAAFGLPARLGDG